MEAEKCAFLVGMFGHVARLGCLNTGFESEVVKGAMPKSLVNRIGAPQEVRCIYYSGVTSYEVVIKRRTPKAMHCRR